MAISRVQKVLLSEADMLKDPRNSAERAIFTKVLAPNSANS